MKHHSVLKLLAVTALALGSLSVQAQLAARDINGDGATDAYYDSSLDITWLADFNYAATTGYKPNPFSNGSGGMTVDEANTWANSLNYLGVTGWRLPTVTPVNGTSFNYNKTENGTSDYGTALTGIGWGSASELGHLFYVTLGNTGNPHPKYDGSDIPALTNVGSFLNLTANTYWSGPRTFNGYGLVNYGWDFDFWDGSQDEGNPANTVFAVAVHNGDVGVPSPVPEPSAYAMMLAGLAGLSFVTKRRSSPAA